MMESLQDKRILLHACCGPCSLGALPELISDGAAVSLYFYNPCIIPVEFEKRLEAIAFVAEHYGVPLIVPPHDYSAYLKYASEFAACKEGGARCNLCIADRLKASAEYAAVHGFDMYTTTLTVSPLKNSKLIFELGQKFAVSTVPFLSRDFKKRDGYLNSCRRSREFSIYRQNFCGCEFSVRQSSGVKEGGVQ